ncbi:MAG: penicillin-binding transpeptidase domain-containing protein, partial [Actinomycetota bacterium]|nr:penicillin-binding transpeptidase domain-containing protein [Actinomycetota bacterium]
RMHRLLTDAARARFDSRELRSAYERARAVATATGVRVAAPEGERGGEVLLPVAIPTLVFGTIRGQTALPVRDGAVDWRPRLVFPGLADGESLTRKTQAPRRGRILSADGKTLAEGPAGARSSPLAELGASVAGTVGEAENGRERRELFYRGFPGHAPLGKTGLERIFERRLAGRPGGVLLAGRRVLRRGEARAAAPVRSTIDTRIQGAAVEALAGRLGGIAALDPATGAVRALAGVAFSAPQPPGSTFKIVTTTAALEAEAVKPSDKFPVQSSALIDGVELENANGELCGGTFEDAFAHSCNSVFGPLGVKVGSRRLVEVAERYGWNKAPTLAGEKPSTLPESEQIVSPLEIGSTAIGQFKTLATPLLMASVAQTVANGGVRLPPTVASGERARGLRVTSRAVSATLERLMVAVVARGTGTAAAIPGAKVAGKTGTAELEDTRGPGSEETASGDPANTDAWFTAFAPAGRPRIAVAVLLVRNGAGGTTAAPAARTVLASALAPRR